MISFFADDVEMPGGIEEGILVPVLEKICRDHNRTIDYINVVFVSDENLLQINRDFLKHDYYTDIITFNYADEPKGNIEGELYVSVDRIIENARALNLGEDEELSRVIIHGVLHLCGFEDNSEQTKTEMQEAENKYLKDIVSRET